MEEEESVVKRKRLSRRRKRKVSKDKLGVTYGHEHGSTIVNHGHRRQVLGRNSLPEQNTHMESLGCQVQLHSSPLNTHGESGLIA